MSDGRLLYIHRDLTEILTYAGMGLAGLLVALAIGFGVYFYERHRDTPVVYDD